MGGAGLIGMAFPVHQRRDVTPITAIMKITRRHSYGEIAASADS
jgi:hypothetical protein